MNRPVFTRLPKYYRNPSSRLGILGRKGLSIPMDRGTASVPIGLPGGLAGLPMPGNPGRPCAYTMVKNVQAMISNKGRTNKIRRDNAITIPPDCEALEARDPATHP